MDILTQLSDSLQQGNPDTVSELTRKALEQKLTPKDILDKGLIAGMNIVGQKFKNHDIFLPDVLLAAKAMYAGLDLKANQTITKLKTTLREFMYFVVKFINDRDNTTHDYKSVKFVFNKSMIFNVNEIIEGLMLLKGTISEQTLLSNIPYVDNVQKEMELIENENRVTLE